MRRIKTQEGITLVALIITIIILLILAAVTIMALNGEDGIIGKSKQAKIEYEKKQEEEKGILEKLEGMLTGGESAKEETPEGDNGSEGGDSNSGDGSLAGGNSGENSEENSSGNNSENNSSEKQNPNIASYTEDRVPIPVGFKYITGEKDTGVVVQNEADGSEFVWVPVNTTIEPYGLGTTSDREPDVVTGDFGTEYDNDSTNLNIINNILGTSYNNSNDFLEALQEDFNLMAESVNENHGFYVGRYETSLSEGRAQSVKGAISATAEESSANTWYGLYAYQKAYSTSSVQGSMIWGSQYDAMMTWMGDAANTTIGDNRNLTRKTGTAQYDVIKKVYDLYGCYFEWTLVADNTYSRVARGGTLVSGNNVIVYPPSSHNNYCPTSDYSFQGSRLVLYIK